MKTEKKGVEGQLDIFEAMNRAADAIDRMVEEDQLLQAPRIRFAVVRKLQHHLGKAVGIAGQIQAEAVGLDLLDDGRRIEPNVTAGVPKTLTTAAAEVEAVPQEDQGRGRVFGGYVAEGLVRVDHEGSPLNTA